MRVTFVLLAAAGIAAAVTPSTSRSTESPREWRRFGPAWQIVSDGEEEPSVTDELEQTRKGCPAGMVRVEGAMKRGAGEGIELLQDATCLEWEPKSFPGRCLRFDADRWAKIASGLPVAPMRFCIDRFELPNRRGAYPVVAVTWFEASAFCSAEGKRLCSEDEWTFACEGEDALPYPYGYERDDTACVIDRVSPAFDEAALGKRDLPRFAEELERLWRGEPSGSRARCKSVFGVYDLTGNVDEWTVSSRSDGRRSILKGGYWGRVRTRCRPSTRAHGEGFYFYQQGVRCCADAP